MSFALVRVAIFTDHARHIFAGINGDGLIQNAPLLGVVTHFYLTGRREIFAERMSHETIVGQQAAQIRVTFKNNAE